MAKPLPPIPLLPQAAGINKKTSRLAAGSRWIDADKVRFVSGLPEKIGGWSKKTTDTVSYAIRGVLPWTTAAQAPFLGFGTYKKLWVADQSLAPVDITPIQSSGTLTDPFTAALDSSTIIVEHSSHGRSVGDEVRFPDGSDPIGSTGITITGTYEVISIIDEDHYTVEHSVVAVDDGTGGGTVNYEYELPIGGNDPFEGDGYGAGGYGLGGYGEPSESAGGIVFEPRIWSLDRYGDLMLANPINRGIFVFDPADTPAYQRATALSGAPTVCKSMFVTEERFIFALGVDNDPLLVKWPDQDDPTNWTAGAASTANARRLKEGSTIVGGRALTNLLSGVWTDTALYQFQYTGSSFIYDSKCVGTNCGLSSPMALIVNLAVAYWLGKNGSFFMWGGGAPAKIPNSDDVDAYVQRQLRLSGYEYKCNAFYNATFNEVWWFFVNTDETEPGLYVAVTLDDFAWTVGAMERTSGAFFKTSDQRPILGAVDGYLYQHEDGLDADGELMQAFIERAPLQFANGGQLGEITGFINDMERQIGTMSIEAKSYDRIDDDVLDQERVSFEPGENLVDIRVGGRIAGIIIRSEALGGDFRLGNPMLEVMTTGRRR